MEIENINIHSLPSLLIPERFNLPEIGAIYFVLSENNDVEYIGKAKNLRKRWRTHECCMNLDSPKTCRVAWFEIVDEDKRAEFEKRLIRKLNPKNNANFIVKSPKPKLIFIAEPAEIKNPSLVNSELTAKEVAVRYDVSPYTVKAWCRKGLFPNARLEETRLGSVWLIPESDLNGFEQPEAGRPPKAKDKGE